MIVQCRCCHRVLIDPNHAPTSLDKEANGFWLPPKIEGPSSPTEVSHTLCPTCENAASASLDEYVREQGERLQAAAGRVVREEGAE